MHYGVKGMHWGVRKSNGAATAVTVRTGGFKGRKLKAKGGEGHTPSKDATRAAEIGQIRRKSGAHALTNEELAAYNKRLDLEANAQRLNYNQSSAGKKFVLSILGQTGKNQASQVANQAASVAVKKGLTRAGLAVLA